MNAYVIAGTGVDEGIAGLAKVADSSLGGTAWTGASVLTQGVLALGASQVRYVAVAQMPASATELGIALCYTPAASTALPGDYIAFDNVQLRENSGLGAYVNAAAGYLASKLPASAYAAKTAQAEAEAQYRYFYELKDNLPTTARFGTCQGASATQAFCSVELPEAMRVAPAVTVAVPSSFSITTPAQVSQACTALAGVTGGSTAQLGQLSCTSAGLAAGGAYTFGSWNTGAGSYVSFSADF